MPTSNPSATMSTKPSTLAISSRTSGYAARNRPIIGAITSWLATRGRFTRSSPDGRPRNRATPSSASATSPSAGPIRSSRCLPGLGHAGAAAGPVEQPDRQRCFQPAYHVAERGRADPSLRRRPPEAAVPRHGRGTRPGPQGSAAPWMSVPSSPFDERHRIVLNHLARQPRSGIEGGATHRARPDATEDCDGRRFAGGDHWCQRRARLGQDLARARGAGTTRLGAAWRGRQQPAPRPTPPPGRSASPRPAYADAAHLFRDPSIDIVAVAVKVPDHRALVLDGRGRRQAPLLRMAARPGYQAETVELAAAIRASGRARGDRAAGPCSTRPSGEARQAGLVRRRRTRPRRAHRFDHDGVRAGGGAGDGLCRGSRQRRDAVHHPGRPHPGRCRRGAGRFRERFGHGHDAVPRGADRQRPVPAP